MQTNKRNLFESKECSHENCVLVENEYGKARAIKEENLRYHNPKKCQDVAVQKLILENEVFSCHYSAALEISSDERGGERRVSCEEVLGY